MDSFISTFHIDWKILIAQAVNFGIIFLVLYFFALKPLSKIMRERTNIIEKGLTDAKENAALLVKADSDYKQTLAQARIEAHDIFQKGKDEAEVKKAEILSKTQGEVEAMILSGKRALEAEKAKIMDEAKSEIVSLVVKATEKLLDTTDDKKFEEKTLAQIKKMH